MLVSLVITLLIVGVLLYLVNAYLPMQAQVKQILNIVVVVALVIYVVVALIGYHFPAYR